MEELEIEFLFGRNKREKTKNNKRNTTSLPFLFRKLAEQSFAETFAKLWRHVWNAVCSASGVFNEIP